VFNARVMMLVNALTMESPVITVYKMAPNAAAAMVPIAYSIVEFCTIKIPLVDAAIWPNARMQLL
jgi:hypothetical protein